MAHRFFGARISITESDGLWYDVTL
jgi:hypothetical protein